MATTENLLGEISGKLDKVLGVLLAQGKDTETQIKVLRALGHDWPFVGAVTGLSPDAARMRKPRKNAKGKA